MPIFEKLKQSLQAAPTGSATTRNELMVEELKKFAQCVKLFQEEYQALSKETNQRLSVLASMFDKPLPRVFREGGDGAQPAEDVIRRIGPSAANSAIDKAKTELEKGMRDDVFLKLEKWVADYRDAKAAHRENLRLLGCVQEQKKVAASLREKYEKQAHQGSKDTEITHAKARFEEEKYKEYQRHYKQREAEVNAQLVQLIKRSSNFKYGIATSLMIFQGAFKMVYQSLDTSSSPNRSSSSGHKSSNSNSQSQSTNTQAHKSSRVHEPEEHRMEGSPPSPTDSAMGMMAATTRAEASPYLATLPVTLSDVREMTRQNPLYGASPVKVPQESPSPAKENTPRMPDSPTLPVPKEIPTATKTPAAAAKSSIPKPANTKPSPPSVTSSAQAKTRAAANKTAGTRPAAQPARWK